jgi:hypothetical protein
MSSPNGERTPPTVRGVSTDERPSDDRDPDA